MLQKDPRVDGDIDGEREAAEEQLIAARETFWIENRKNVMGDEIALVSGLSLLPAQPVLERRQRTDPPGELDEHPPDNRRNMQPDHARPPEHQNPAEHDEDYECKMKEEDEVRCYRLLLQLDRGEQLIEILLLCSDRFRGACQFEEHIAAGAFDDGTEQSIARDRFWRGHHRSAHSRIGA